MGRPSERAFQDDLAVIGVHSCWGCGAGNVHGLRIKSYWSDADDGDVAVCTWHAQPYHVGWDGIMNGGVIATIMDCHTTCTAIANAYRVEGRGILSLPALMYVTASLHITYRRPTPITEPLSLRAWVTDRTERKTFVTCMLVAAGEERARADAVIVRVPASHLSPMNASA